MKLMMFRPVALLSAALLAACGGGPGFAARFTVGGSVSGLSASGLVLQLNGGDDLAIAASGNFDFSTQLDNGSPYTVTVLTQPTGLYCSIANGIGTVNSANTTNVAVRCAASNANLVAYDGFNYVAGQPLAGRNGGIGWSAAWQLIDGSANTSLDSAKTGSIVAGLNYVDANSSKLVTTDGAWKTDATVFFAQARRASSSSFGAAGTSRWISFLVRQAAASPAPPATPAFNYVSGTLGTGYTFASPAMMGDVGLYSSGGVAAIGAFYDNTASGVALSPNSWYEGATGLVVLRITFNASGNDTMDLWFNPLLTSDPGSPLVTASVANYADLINGITMSWGDYRSFVIDEVRIGNDYASVTPHL